MSPLKPLAQRTIKSMLYGTDLLQRRAKTGTAFLIYHSVGDQLSIELELSPALLQRQLAYLAEKGRVMAYAEAVAALSTAAQTTAPKYVLTFDDGYRDFYTTVFPLLKEFQLPATLFVTTGFVDERRPYPMLSYPQLAVEPVTWAMLGEMVDSGLVTLGAHTHTHPVLTACTPDQVAEELERPLHRFQQELRMCPTHFCYPQACWNEAVEEQVKQYYTTAVIGGGHWAESATFHPLRIPRLPIRRSDGWTFFRAKVNGRMANEEAFYTRLKQLMKHGRI